MLTQQEIREWASAYIEAERSPHKLKADYPLWWAINRFMEKMTPAWAEECWKAILEVLSQQPPPEVLAVLAAGPLEDLIDDQGQAFIERIERQAALDPAFRHLLGGVWESGSPDVWSRVQKARGERW